MSVPTVDNPSSDILRSVVEHVFMPPRLPQKHPDEETVRKTNWALCNSLIEAAHDFLKIIPSSECLLWMRMIKMMEMARHAANVPLKEDSLRRAFSDMIIGDVLCMHIRAQNAALIVRRLATADFVQFEVFEVLPLINAVMAAEGKLLCSYPGPAVQIPTDVFMDECFLRELSSFLVQMDVDHLDPLPTTNSSDHNIYDGSHPGYISELLVGILRGYGQPADVDRFTKRIGDEALLSTGAEPSDSSLDSLPAELPDKRWWEKLSQWRAKLSKRQNRQGHDGTGGAGPSSLKPWRRSPLWLILRVSLQSSLRSGGLYKPFILFFHTHLLRTCVRREFPSELLYLMRAKISRRLSKLGPILAHDVYPFVRDIAKATETLLSKRWAAFQNIESIDAHMQLKGLDFIADSAISLDHSYDYLTKALRPAPRGVAQNQFIPSQTFRIYEVRDFTQFAKGQLRKAISEDPFTALADFELSVERNLEYWVAASTNNNDALDVIESCILQYFSGAKNHYKDNPEDNSIMVLTIMALWVALDRLTIQECPLLKEYPPEIPSNFLHPLLLHRPSALKCALLIEEYLCLRHKQALEVPSVFSNIVNDSCFAVKYYHASKLLQRLHDEVSRHLEQDLHSVECRPCKLKTQARNLHSIHEWSLPPSMAQQIIFELSTPHAFSIWRNITYMILCDIGMLSSPESHSLSNFRLDAFPSLQRWTGLYRKYDERVTIASSTPPSSFNMHVESTEEYLSSAVNQRSFNLFDQWRNSWVVGPFSKSSPSKLCTPPLPKSSLFNRLHPFISGTEHTPNDIITAQANCPKEINEHEFLAFTGLRCGPRLQWLNIARELASPFLSFNREEVHTLITQAAWQLGPLSNSVREWHVDLTVFSFGNTLLHEMEYLLVKIRANWLEEVTVRTIVLICNRLLTSTTDPDLSRRAYALLLEARSVTYRWIYEVQETLGSTQDETSRTGLRHRLCMIAMACFSTFDRSSEHMADSLVSGKDFSIAVECAVIVYDNTPRSPSDNNSCYLNRTLRRHRRLLHNLEHIFGPSMRSIRGGAGFPHAGTYNEAFARLRPGYRPGNTSNWHVHPRPNSRWISCITGEGQKVYYDLLTGELIMGGKQLDKLPQEIVEHPTYIMVFGKRILDVSPADVHGMIYMTRSAESGYQVLFSWNNGDLVLQARNTGGSQILQLIPHSVLLGDFPRHFVDEYIHWLDLKTGELEFRPAGSPWTSRPHNWRLYIQRPSIKEKVKDPDTRTHALLQKLSKDDFPTRVIDIHSRTFAVVSSFLSPLESADQIIAMHTAQSLEVSLPRLSLSFFLNASWELECRSIPGYIIDKTQSCGTMFGLRNKLVLCPSPTSSEDHLRRRVIIPQGEISYGRDGDFSNVLINTGAGQHVRWHEYTVDTDLGCLTGNTVLISKLYQCYLHALTSHCLPDPLLGQTGTEEALFILRSAVCRSFQRLDIQEAMLLELISKLSPDRRPSSMLTSSVQWDDLPVLSQHDDFHRTVCSILDHAHALEALYHLPAAFNISNRNQMMLNRAAHRNKVYYPSDLHISEQSSPLHDVVYMSRDAFCMQTAGHMAFQTSWSIWNDWPSLDPNLPELWSLMHSWDSLGPAGRKISLRYSRYWLKFDVALDWFGIYDLCRKSVNRNRRVLKIELSFSFSAAAYSRFKDSNITEFLMIFALDERFCNLSPPSGPSYHYTLSHGQTPDREYLENIISESTLNVSLSSREREDIRSETSKITNSILHLWPDFIPVDFPEKWFNRSLCNLRIKQYFVSIFQNIRLKEHILELQDILQRYRDVSIPATLPYRFSPQFTTGRSKSPSYSLRDVLTARTATLIPAAATEPSQSHAIFPIEATESAASQAGLEGLELIVEELKHSRRPLLQHYGDELNKSRRELRGKLTSQFARDRVPSQEDLLRYHEDCSREKSKIFFEISAILAPSQNVEETSHIAGLWPRITPRSMLRQLAQDRICTLSDEWKSVIVRYAISFLKHLQSLRILRLSLRQNFEELLPEIETIRYGVLTESTPDWLLVQIEAHIVARPVQVAIAREMISPSTKRNISLQLNMGEGKSSVIVPFVASTLSNGSNLVRVVTLKPLSNQMFQLLISKLSGLANRPILYVPVSRGLRMDTSMVRTIRGLYERCVAEGGVLVVQPEHILSQKLKHIEVFLRPQRSSEEQSVANELKQLQDWLANVSRDVLDESDEILHPRFQLIYSTGRQMSVDDHPNRWTTVQQVFSRLQAHAVGLHTCFPKMFEIDTTLRGFPILHIRDSSIFQRISSLVIDDALEGRLPNLQVGVLPPSVRAASRRFLSQTEVSDVDHALIHTHYMGTTTFKGFLLLRGLLMDGGGILGYVLKERRWNVDYGLDPSRTLLAVPYRAKGVPSLRAEFSHPDVAITLTCLSYYYGGLTKAQVLLCFDLLAKLNNPEMEYDHWVESGQGQGFPMELRQLKGVNMEDETQVNEALVPLFSRNKGVVDFYLSQVVFPQAAREFPYKLPTSAWDLVEHKNITTGFSGTNDNQHLLPSSITQEDPDFVLGTNALVLQHLLRPENDHYECTEGDNGERESATLFLRRLARQNREVRVLLDIGAQILELQNEELARYWLSLRPDVSAAIFFNDTDHLTVVAQDGTIEPFISSPFNRQLEKCVIYIDDAHTRGTDLKLPRGMRAAVTLGPKVTKDRLVQGCMRMRQLGKGHSVMFFAPGVVDRSIRSLIPGGMAFETSIRAIDVIRWAVHRTCEDIDYYLQYWAQQGLDHHRRFTAYEQYRSSGDLAVLREAWLQSESKTLVQMYWIESGAQMRQEVNGVPMLRERMERLGVTKLISARMAEEQEREVNHELEPGIPIGEVPQSPHLPKVQPAQHIIHADILEFIETGKVLNSSTHISPLLNPLNMVKSLASTIEWSPSPLATADFITTILDSNGDGLTEYLRPVNWILSSGRGAKSTVVVISPYEANELLPIIRKNNKVKLHIYAPRVTLSMRSFSDLTFYSIPDSQAERWSAPAHIRTELNLFAGQLYFDSREEYESTCVLLALWMAHPKAEYSELDGFVPPAYRTGRSSPLARSRIPILKILMGLRWKGKGYHLTHMGQVLNGKPLGEETVWDVWH